MTCVSGRAQQQVHDRWPRAVRRQWCTTIAILITLTYGVCTIGESANPVLNTVFPAGGQAGSSVDVQLTGSQITPITTLTSSAPGISFQKLDKQRMRITIPATTAPGLYDLRTWSPSGLSSARTFAVGRRPECLEQPTDSKTQQSLPLNTVVNGRISKGGQIDRYDFTARRGQRMVVECWAERIDSRLRGILEIYDDKGRRLAVNRGYVGHDPLIDFTPPHDGVYHIRVFDLIYSGSDDHVYRLVVDTGPRIAFCIPAVIRRGQKQRVSLYGWNLHQPRSVAANPEADAAAENPSDATQAEAEKSASKTADVGNGSHSLRSTSGFDRLDVVIQPPEHGDQTRRALRLRPAQVSLDGFAYQHPQAQAPVHIGLTDVPVYQDRADNHVARQAQPIDFPCEVSGRLTEPGERDWFAVDVRRGEVLWIEVFGDRIDAPLDPDVSLLDATGTRELAHFHDDVRNLGGKRFPSRHLDPSGRWVAPADGRYLILVRSLTGSLEHEPRRLYRLSVRRQEPAFDLCVVPRGGTPSSLNVQQGGRTVLDVLAFRRRGLQGSIRVTAEDLPQGLECPDIWLGPGVDRAPLVITGSKTAVADNGQLRLVGHVAAADTTGSPAVQVQAATVVRDGLPNGWSRMTDTLPIAVSGHSPLRIIADGHETRKHHLYGEMQVRHSPGGILDVAVQIERRTEDRAPVRLFGVNLPPMIRNCTTTIPAERDKGYISFHLPATLPVGRYTIAVRAETTMSVTPGGDPSKRKTQGVTLFSNPVTFDVAPPAFVVEIDAEAPTEVKRGQRVQIKYTARRINGFINKIHTELAAAGEVRGLRGRGVTFVGQTESGTIQIVANEDAQLGRQQFLRLYAVGVVEDQPVYHGSCFLNLGVVE